MLVHCARATVDQWHWFVDLRYLRELHERGFEVDYTDVHEEFTWERIRRYDVLVIYGVPLERGRYHDNTPDRPPYRDAFVEIVERFLASGGGVFLMARSLNADESFLPLLRPWDARIPYERIQESDPDKLAPTPHMRGSETLWFTRNVAASPVSDGVEQVWIPLTRLYAASETMPIRVGPDWTVVLRGSRTSRTVPIDPAKEPKIPPTDRIARPGGVREPELFAVREYGAGRIAFCAVWPQYSIGQGTEWLYDRRVLSRGIGARRSDFGRLIENTLRWLAAPRAADEPFVTDPERLLDPNERPGVKERFVERSLTRFADEPTRANAPILRGLIGAETAGASVADYARAARESGLDFVVFLEQFRSLTADALERLKTDCREHSGDDLQLVPGYRIETNTGNRLFLFGREVTLPPAELVVDGRLNQQHQDPRTGEYATGGVFIDWLSYRVLPTDRVNVGYYGFQDRPHAQRLSGLRIYSIVGLRLYRDGELVEDNFEDYLLTAAGGLPPAPASVHLLSTPRALREAAERETGLTYAQAADASSLWRALGYGSQYVSPNVFPSDGPRIHDWPRVFQVYTFAAERFVSGAARVRAPLSVSSEAGLKEIRIYDGTRLFRRFGLDGERSFEITLDLDATVQRTLVLLVEDANGRAAVSNALRSWKGGGLAPVFCSDRVNHCDLKPLLARGPGNFRVSHTPMIHGGHTWDGGPRGERPVMELIHALRPALESNKGREGARGFDNLPLVELADEGAVRVRAVLDTLYDPQVPVVDPWQTYGPLGGPSRLFDASVTHTAFERPSVGPHPNLYPGFAIKRGAAVSLFENDVVFRKKQRVRSLRLFRQRWHAGPFPVTLVHGRGAEVLGAWKLSPGDWPAKGPRIETGDWIGCYGPEPTNLSVHFNRGEPLELVFEGRDRLTTAFYGAAGAKKVRRGATKHFELLSVVDPVDAPQQGTGRVQRVVSYLARPDGLRVTRGKRLDGLPGLVELEAPDGAAAITVQRPDPRADLSLPVRVHGLNPRWTAGVQLVRGYVLGNYDEGDLRFREAGFDADGRIYASLFPDLAETTEVIIGNPVVSDRGELFLEVAHLGGHDWRVAVNNPTDETIQATFRVAMPLPGLQVPGDVVRLAAGAHVVLQRPD